MTRSRWAGQKFERLTHLPRVQNYWVLIVTNVVRFSRNFFASRERKRKRGKEHETETALSSFSEQDSGLARSSKTGPDTLVSSTLPNIPVYTSPTRRDGSLLSKSAVDVIATCVTSHETDIIRCNDTVICGRMWRWRSAVSSDARFVDKSTLLASETPLCVQELFINILGNSRKRAI